MSKKKRKTRAEKEQPKKYDFKEPVYRMSVNKGERVDNQTVPNKRAEVDPRVLMDLRKVGLIIAVMLILIGITAFLVYRTNVINPIFSKLGISY